MESNEFVVKVKDIAQFKLGKTRGFGIEIMMEGREEYDKDALSALYQVIQGGVLNTTVSF